MIRSTRPTRRWAALVLTATVALAACGDDDGGDVRNIGGTGTGAGSESGTGSGSPSGSPSAPASGSPTEAGE